MRFVFLVLFMPLSAFAALSFDYTATAGSWMKMGQTTQIFSDTQHNAGASALKKDAYPFAGVAASNDSPGNFTVGGLVLRGTTTQYTDLWGHSEILGTISAGSTGTLNIEYHVTFGGSLQLPYESFGLLIGRNNFNQLLVNCVFEGIPQSFSVPVNAGEQLDFRMWYSIGSENQPAANIANYHTIVNTSFSFVPEPATLGLIIGGFILSRRHLQYRK